MRLRCLILSLVVSFWGSAAFGQTCQSPRYPPNVSHLPLGGATNCANRCLNGPMKITPIPIQACEDETIHPNIFVQNNAMSNGGDTVLESVGTVDWDDGNQNQLTICCKWTPTHAYPQANTYCMSATYHEDLNNAGGTGCSYRCSMSAATPVVVFMKTSKQCIGGKFRAGTTRKSASH